MDIIEALVKVGFTRHEASLYNTLCKEGEMTGYEAAKISGIPRSNTYLALAGLVDKGAAYKIEGDVVKYIAVPGDELVANIKRQTQEILDYIKNNLPVRQEASEPFITVAGKTHIVNKMNTIINKAQHRVYVSMTEEDIHYVQTSLDEARSRNLKVVIITSGHFRMEGVKVYHNEKQPGQIRVIADSAYVLTGEINSTCLYSRNKNLIQLIKDSLANEIKLIEMKNVE